MKYQKQVSVSGGWVDKSLLKNGQRAKIVSETQPVPSQYTKENGETVVQNLAKVHFEGQKEAVNVPLNRVTINALIEAFGDDSNAWQGHYLTVETEKARVAGRSVVALYLIPAGYEKTDDDNGYAVIRKQVKKENPEIPIIEEGEPVDEINLPF